MRTASLFCSIPAASPGRIELPQPTFVASALDPLAGRRLRLPARSRTETTAFGGLRPGPPGRGECARSESNRDVRFRRPRPGSTRTSARGWRSGRESHPLPSGCSRRTSLEIRIGEVLPLGGQLFPGRGHSTARGGSKKPGQMSACKGAWQTHGSGRRESDPPGRRWQRRVAPCHLTRTRLPEERPAPEVRSRGSVSRGDHPRTPERPPGVEPGKQRLEGVPATVANDRSVSLWGSVVPRQ